MYLFNYSSLKQRDTKIYDIGGKSISGGLSIDFLKVTLRGNAQRVISSVHPFCEKYKSLLGIPFGISVIPLTANFKLWWLVIWLALGIGVGLGLWYIQFAGYRLYQYLIAYLKPKKVYMNDWKTTEFHLTDVSIKSMVKKIL